jgi:hypothetical protein
MKIFYFVFAIGLLPVLNGVGGQPAQAQTAANALAAAVPQPLRIRKDWEELTPPEKAAFAHANDMLKKKASSEEAAPCCHMASPTSSNARSMPPASSCFVF